MSKVNDQLFWSKVEKVDTCWLYSGTLNDQGYGIVSYGHTRKIRAHRYSYELVNGPIPEGMVLDHICRVRNCVRPIHLRVVTRGENVLLGTGLAAQKLRQQHCCYGHSLDDAIRIQKKDGIRRTCRKCNQIRCRNAYLKRTSHLNRKRRVPPLLFPQPLQFPPDP